MKKHKRAHIFHTINWTAYTIVKIIAIALIGFVLLLFSPFIVTSLVRFFEIIFLG